MVNETDKPLAEKPSAVDGYTSTVLRFEPNIWATDPAAYGTSAAISLRRIADGFDRLEEIFVNIERRLNELVIQGHAR